MATSKKPSKKTTPKKQTVKNPFVANPDSLITQTICKNIRSLYEEKKKKQGWTQEDFGKHIGVPLPYMKAVLQGKFAPSHAVMAQVSKLFNITTDEIYGLNG